VGVATESGADCGALAEIAAAWAHLSAEQRAAVLAIVRGAGEPSL
jgi:hypothetical protein